jgi:hypothetical protein
VLCAALLGGCSGGPPKASAPRATASSVADRPPVEPSGTVVVAHPRQPVDVPGGQSAAGDLIGFAVRVKLRWRVTTDRLSAETARLLQLDNPSPRAPVDRASARPAAPVKAPAGRELVVVQLDSWTPDTAGRRPWDKPNDATVSVAVGDEAVNVQLDILDVLIVSAPKGAPVLVKLTEYGRTQSLDLRTGAPGPDLLAEMSGPRDLAVPVNYTADGPVSSHGITRPFKVHLSGAKGELQPHLKELGWAAPGRQWMLVPIHVTTNGIPDSDSPPGWFWVDFKMNTAKSFTVVLPSGQRVAPRVAPQVDLTIGLRGGAEGSAGIIFDVPAGITGATLHITLTGSMTAQFRNGTFPTRWNKTPPPADAALTASPL